eukprot:Skav216107  [mRNA]  locus=scaffold1946:40388:59628:+ [translate_table: standard]
MRIPAAAVERVEEEPQEWLRRFEAGEEVKGVDLSPGAFKKGLKILAEKGVYYGQEAAVAVVVDHEEVDGADRELVGTLSGTKNEELLKVATASQPFTLRIHLCGDDCMQNRVNPNLVHVAKVKKMMGGIPTWEENLVANEEMEAPRRDQEDWQGREKEKSKKKKSTSSSSSSKGKKKKKKKKKKKSKKEDENKAGGAEGDKVSPAAAKEKTKKLGSRSHAKKDLEAIYGGTGMDPDQKKRKRIARRVKKALRKGKTTSSSSGSSSESSLEEEKEEILLEDRNKVHRIAQLCPGLLSSLGIEAMRPFLLQLGSTGWETEGSQIPPLLSLYYRTYMCNRLSGGVQREFATLAWLSDLMVQGRIAEALDTAIQRMKAIELVSKGESWQARCAGWMFSSRCSTVPTEPDVAVEEQSQRLIRYSQHNLRPSLETPLRQRLGELDGGDTSFLLFETTNFPKPKIQRRCEAAMLRPVTPLALNSGETVVNEYFSGKLLMMHRPTSETLDAPHAQYFAKKTRRWELRLQGRFHKRPNGKLYMGVVLRDFDYSMPLSYFTSWVSTLSVAPLDCWEYVLGSKVMLSFGDREEAMPARQLRINAFDQIIVTPPGAQCLPPIDGDLDGWGVTRKGAKNSAEWSSSVEDTETTRVVLTRQLFATSSRGEKVELQRCQWGEPRCAGAGFKGSSEASGRGAEKRPRGARSLELQQLHFGLQFLRLFLFAHLSRRWSSTLLQMEAHLKLLLMSLLPKPVAKD